MSPARRRAFILGVLGLLGVMAGLLWLSRSSPAVKQLQQIEAPRPPPAPTPSEGDARIPESAMVPPATVLPMGVATKQIVLQRTVFDAGLRSLTDNGRVPSGPVDRRGNAGPNAAREMEIISYAFETLEEDVRACLEQWGDAPPAEVMIAFEIDANGLQKSWLEHQTEVPFGSRTCLANAVYGLDWSKIVDHPAKLTQRFELGRKDAN